MSWLRRWTAFVVRDEMDGLRGKLAEAERSLEEERRSRQMIEVSAAALQQENAFLRERFDAAIKNERDTLRMLANISMQSRYGMTPYPEAQGLPENGKVESVEQPEARVQGQDLVRMHTQTFLKNYREKFDRGEFSVPPERLEEWARNL